MAPSTQRCDRSDVTLSRYGSCAEARPTSGGPQPVFPTDGTRLSQRLGQPERLPGREPRFERCVAHHRTHGSDRLGMPELVQEYRVPCLLPYRLGGAKQSERSVVLLYHHRHGCVRRQQTGDAAAFVERPRDLKPLFKGGQCRGGLPTVEGNVAEGR
jgi:hypothetical protein